MATQRNTSAPPTTNSTAAATLAMVLALVVASSAAAVPPATDEVLAYMCSPYRVNPGQRQETMEHRGPSLEPRRAARRRAGGSVRPRLRSSVPGHAREYERPPGSRPPGSMRRRSQRLPTLY